MAAVPRLWVEWRRRARGCVHIAATGAPRCAEAACRWRPQRRALPPASRRRLAAASRPRHSGRQKSPTTLPVRAEGRRGSHHGRSRARRCRACTGRARHPSRRPRQRRCRRSQCRAARSVGPEMRRHRQASGHCRSCRRRRSRRSSLSRHSRCSRSRSTSSKPCLRSKSRWRTGRQPRCRRPQHLLRLPSHQALRRPPRRQRPRRLRRRWRRLSRRQWRLRLRLLLLRRWSGEPRSSNPTHSRQLRRRARKRRGNT